MVSFNHRRSLYVCLGLIQTLKKTVKKTTASKAAPRGSSNTKHSITQEHVNSQVFIEHSLKSNLFYFSYQKPPSNMKSMFNDSFLN